MLTKKFREKTGEVEWCLVSKSSDRVLEWYGKEKPSEERVQESEKRIQYYKHSGK